MDTIIAALGAVARLAPTADRAALVSLDAKRRTLDAAAKVAIALGTLEDAGILETGSAHVTAQEAIQTRFAVMEAQHLAVIQAVPTDRRSRRTLMPAATPAELSDRLDAIEYGVTFLVREKGTPLHVLRDGAVLGGLDAYDITVGGNRIALGTRGTFELADIVATSVEDEDFAILLADGTLLEIQEDADYVWQDPSAAKAA